MKSMLLVLLCALMALTPLSGQSTSGSFLQNPDAIEETAKSVLFLGIFYNEGEIVSTASGFVAFDSQTIVTNYHVIEDAALVFAGDESDNVYEVDRIIAADEEKDIVILSLSEKTNLTPLHLAENAALKRGQPVLAIGSPEGFKNSVSTGIISAVYDPDDTPDIQFTAPISHGSSGGALLDDAGRVVGVTTSTIRDGQNINFAVGSSHVIELYRRFNPNYVTVSSPGITATPKASPTISATAQPYLLPPRDVRARVSNQSVILEWSEVIGATSYKVYRTPDLATSVWGIGSVRALGFTDTNTEEGMLYTYRVTALSTQIGESQKSLPVEVFVPLSTATEGPALATPVPTKAPTPTPHGYSDPAELAKYKTLQVGTKDADVATLKERMYVLGYFGNRIVNNNYTENTAQAVREFQRTNGLPVTGVATPEMQALFYSERAIAKGGKPAGAVATQKPKAPTNLKVNTSSGRAVLTWTAVPGATGYQIFRSSSAEGTYSHLGLTAKTTYTDFSSIRGSTYYYKALAVHGPNEYSERSKYVKAVMPKPTSVPYVEPKYPLDFGDDGYTGTTGAPSLNPKIVNISKQKTVDGFTLIYYCTDVYGTKLYFNNSTDYTSIYTYTKTIGPGRSTYPGKVSLKLYGSGVKRVYVAISKIHTTDGRTYSVPDSELSYYYWEMD